MKASLHSVRIAPKKANLVAGMVRGLTVADAQACLQKTNKKAARILESLLASAVANAHHNDNQDPAALVITSLVVNKAQAYHRGVPMARGRVRPMRKFLSHISLTLGASGVPAEAKKTTDASSAAKQSTEKAPARVAAQKTKESSSQKSKKPAQSPRKRAKRTPGASAPGTAGRAKRSATPKTA